MVEFPGEGAVGREPWQRAHSLRPGSRAGITVPMIPLGLKETTELDWSTALKVS